MLGWTLAILAACGASAAAWGQESQTPPAAAGQYAAQGRPTAGDPLTFDDIREVRTTRSGDPPTSGPVGRLRSKVRRRLRLPTRVRRALTPAGAAPAGSASSPKQVGSDLSGIVFFKNGEFLNFSTPNKDFTMHLGGWVQWDNVWWNQPAALQVAQGTRRATRPASLPVLPAAASTTAPTAVCRTASTGAACAIVQEGTFWETGEYRFNWALENDQFSTAGLDEMWVGQNKIPVIGTIRVGHVKNAMGLEGDMTSSSRCMTFMERSSYSEAIELNQNFVTGLWFGNSYFDDRMTYQAVVFRPDNAQQRRFLRQRPVWRAGPPDRLAPL